MVDFASVKGKVVIVTGASKGIGQAIATCYAQHGMKVVCANRNAEQGTKAVETIRNAGGEAVFCQTDCSNSEEIKALVASVKHYGR
jgi:NAD(P)-dependent dehydrogenase (short-subunit alcohol dehydrogenase family)